MKLLAALQLDARAILHWAHVSNEGMLYYRRLCTRTE